MPDDKYVRVYYSVNDDPKFDTVRSDAAVFGTWVRLLMVADAVWPASADLPRWVRRGHLTTLITAQIVDVLSDDRFRIRGLDAEREKRASAARVGGLASGRSRTPGTTVDRPLNGRSTNTQPIKDEHRQDEQRQAETRDDFDALDVYHELTGYRPWGQWSGDALTVAARDYRDATVQAAIRTEYALSGKRDDLLKRVQSRLAREAEHARQAKPERKRTARATTDDAERARVAHGLMTGELE